MYIIDYETTKILVKNISDCPLLIPRRHKLCYIINIYYKTYFLPGVNLEYNLEF